jgi:A/G-specific adenine glycosylase
MQLVADGTVSVAGTYAGNAIAVAAANAALDEVLHLWTGLGYYARARNLHKAARLAAPTLPASVTELQALPGIGRSTAHAVAAFAYHTPVPIMDANVKRILCRVFAVSEPKEKAMWEHAHALFDTERPFDYNQAMMDLGATVCTAKNPTCGVCAFNTICQGRDMPLEYPQKGAKKPPPVRRKIIVVHRYEGRYGLRQRRSRFLHGLWGFAEYDACDTSGMERLGSVTQKYSHFTLEGEVYLYDAFDDAFAWFHPREIGTLALSGADHKVLALL